MKAKIYNVLEAINKYGYNNADWGVCEEVNSSWYFGVEEEIDLIDKYLYIYVDKDDLHHFCVCVEVPDITLTTDQEDCFVMLYKL